MKRTRLLISAFAALCFTAFSPTVQAQDPPPNDNCSDVTPTALAVGSTVEFTGNNEGATADGDYAPGSLLDGRGPSVWLAFTTTECANVAISYCGSTAPFGAVYFWNVVSAQCPADQLVVTQDYNNSACADGQPTVNFAELAAGTYYYPVWSDLGTSIGDYVISISATSCAAVGPPNDLCNGAQPHDLGLGDTVTITGDNTGATDNDGLGFPAVWESFTIDQCSNVTVDLCGTDPAFADLIADLYADCPATISIDTTSSGTCPDGNRIYTYEGLAPGTYWIPVMDSNGATGAYTMNVTAAACAGPSNNYCNGAELNFLAVDDTLVINGDNTGATDNEGLGYASVWESFTIADCANVELSYCGTDPAFTAAAIPGVYAECPAMDLIAPTSLGACADGNLVANFEGLAAGTYWIPVVMVADEAEGPYTINVSAAACAVVVTPANDLCEDVIPQGLSIDDAVTLTGDNTGATDSEGLGYATVWEAITIAECANVTVSYCDTDSSFTEFAMGIYANCPATQLIPATASDSCDNGNMLLTFESLTPGTYYIPVLMDTANALGEYNIRVRAIACDITTGPVNDLCSNVLPQVLAVGDVLALIGDNTGATDSEGLGYANVWEAFTLTECATVGLDYCSTDTTFTDFAFGIYSDCPATQMIDPSSIDDCGSAAPIQTFVELAPGTYWIPVLMDTANAMGVYTIRVRAEECETVLTPANDLCADASTITVVAPDSCATGAVIGDIGNATSSGNMPTCADSAQHWQDVWYTFDAGDAEEVTITLENGTSAGAGLEVFMGCEDISLACSIDGAPIELAVVSNSTYHVRVFTQDDGTPGTFVLCITSDNTTGVHTTDRGTVQLYPNPSTGDFNFVPSVSWTDASITVLDMTGRTVHMEQANLIAGEVHQLSLAGKLKVGSYLMQVTSAEGSSIVKLMVK